MTISMDYIVNDGRRRVWVLGAVLLQVFSVVCRLSAAELVAYWPLDSGVPPYEDTVGSPDTLEHDLGTTVAAGGAGVAGLGAMLEWNMDPGIATRLMSFGSALQSDSFGFSFWLRPVDLNPGDNLLAKEMPYTTVGNAFTRLAWQLHLLADNGSGLAAAELVVRGDNRAEGDFFGSAVSWEVFPLYTDARDWIHVAGGYDAMTGVISLYVNGIETPGGGAPGASNSGGGAVDIGTVRNGSNFIAYAGTAFVDEVYLYDGPLDPDEVAFLRTNPGEFIRPGFLVAEATHDSGTGTTVLGFSGSSGLDYAVEVATNLSDPQSFTSAVLHTASVPLVHDPGTAPPLAAGGLEGDAVFLNWVDDGTSATRLSTSDPVVQTDSFGFSFWMRPAYLNPYDNLIAKEVGTYDSSANNYERVAWSVQLQNDDGFGNAPLELVVRGDDRNEGSFFGSVVSATVLPLQETVDRWVHVAGGYDATTGGISLYVNGVANLSSGTPGAGNSGGGAFAVGSARNEGDFVLFAGSASIDEVQLFSAPLSADEVNWLMTYPGYLLGNNASLVARWPMDEAGAPFDSGVGVGSMPVSVGIEVFDVEAALGAGPHDTLFFRVKEVMPSLRRGTF